MPTPSQISRKGHVHIKKSPGKRYNRHFIEFRSSVARCAICGKPLHGVRSYENYRMKKLSKSKKRPNRYYGGNICVSCLRNKLIESVQRL